MRLTLNVRVEQSVNSVKRLTFTRIYIIHINIFLHFGHPKPADNEEQKISSFFRPEHSIKKKEISLRFFTRSLIRKGK